MSATTLQQAFSTPTPSVFEEQLQNIAAVTPVMKWVYFVIGIFGIAANLGVMYVFMSSKQMRQHLPNLFLLNQSVADLWSAMFIIASVFKDPHAKLYGIAGELVCRLWLSNNFLWIGFIASLYNLVVLTVERYFAIVHPVKHKLLFTKRKAFLAIVSVWAWSVLYNFLSFFPQSGLYKNTCYVWGFWGFSGARQIYGIANFCIKMLFPVIVFSFCYMAMAKSMKSNKNSENNTHNDATLTSYEKIHRNIFKTLLYAVVLHVVSWIDNQFLVIAYAFGYPLDFSSTVYNIALALIYVSILANPVIYALKYRKFRTAMRQTCCGRQLCVDSRVFISTVT